MDRRSGGPGRLGPPAPPGALPAGLSRPALVGEVADRCRASLEARSRAVVAVSGGPDSTALAYLVAEARPDVELFVAHVRHGLRDDREDAAVAADHAAALGLGYLERAVEVEPSGRGIEDAARRARYTALAALADRVGATVVLVGHTADDRAETVLMNLARGSGLPGVASIRSEADSGLGVTLVRPLLRIRRADVRAFVAGEGLASVRDPTNTDPARRRARARTRVLPALAALTGGPEEAGDPVGALTRMADLARDDADALDALAAERFDRTARRWGPVWCLAETDLAALPPALASRVLRLGIARVRGTLDGVGARAVTDVFGLAPGGAVHLPGGVWVTRGGGWFSVCPENVPRLPERRVRLPGVVALDELGLGLRGDLLWEPAPVTASGQRMLALDALAPPPLVDVVTRQPGPVAALPPGARSGARGWAVLPGGGDESHVSHVSHVPHVVRARRPGDRLRLAHGTRKLQDLFTDLGVPRGIRDLVPVVTDAADEPLWVPGVAVRHWPPETPAHARLWLSADLG